VAQIDEFIADQVVDLVTGVDQVLLDGLAEVAVGSLEREPEAVGLEFDAVLGGCGAGGAGEHARGEGDEAEDAGLLSGGAEGVEE
jgi:hypothetical protein